MSAQHGPPDPNPFPLTVGQLALAFLARCMIRLLGGTLRWRSVGEEHLEAARRSSPTGRIAFAFWHGRQFPLVYVWRNRMVAILTSLSRDGTFQSLILGGLGYHIVRGSTSRGAVRGLVGIIRAVKEDHDTAFAVDGPRGPYHIVKPGILYVAMKTGATIVPITSAVRRSRIFHKAWDRYILPLPFTKAVVMYGEGIQVPPEADADELDSMATALGERLERLTTETEQALLAD